jgi:uncharacterized membrane protein
VVEQLKAAPERLLQAPEYAVRYLMPHRHLGSTFGDDWFGQAAERLARIFGTPKYIAAQSCVVILWIVFNGYSILVHFDKYPFILLNLAFSTQAAYAAPLILLAQTRQADRDKVHAEADAQHREALAQMSIQKQELIERHSEELKGLIQQNTALTEETKKLAERIDGLTAELHKTVCRKPG